MAAIHSLIQAELSLLRSFGQHWAGDILRGAAEDDLIESMKLFSWKTVFFVGSDTLLLLPLVDENFGEGVADEYKLDYDVIKHLINDIENLRLNDHEAYHIVEKLMALVESPYRMSTVTELQWIPKKDQRKVIGTYEQTVDAFKKTVESSSKAPLRNASEFFDVSAQRQREILGIKAD
ncbi:hypothetical protein DL93DRAFT_2231434 [Clavulina sp. PMI_390]|nr:hypothetical protein DL93DRAFT_2231434 [Clavulina sp. PMI_390]